MDYMKKTKGELIAQLLNFKVVVPGQGVLLGFTVAETAAILDSIDLYLQAEGYTTTLREASKAGTEKASAQWKVTETDVRGYVQRVKASPKYTVEIGKLMGIEPETPSVTKAQKKPILKPVITGGSLKVGFNKHGNDAVNLYGKRGAETEYTFQATVLKSPYKDTRENLVPGQPEKRMFKGFYVINDQQQGDPSDEVSIIV